jgi:hypothetical protein
MFAQTTQKTEASKRKTAVHKLLSYLVLPVFLLTIFAGNAHAQIVGDLDVNVPFQFHAGNTKLPAGQYRIHVLDDSDLSVMEITSTDGSISALFQVQQSDANSAPATSELIFNKYGNRYFLTKLFDEGNPSGSQVIESRYEKQVSKAAVDAQEHVPAHHHMQRGK